MRAGGEKSEVSELSDGKKPSRLKNLGMSYLKSAWNQSCIRIDGRKVEHIV